MILSDIVTSVRLDLFDPALGTPHWTNTDLERAIAQAVARYSQFYPNHNWTDMCTQPGQRTYPYPVPANPAYPVLWLERVLYPLQIAGTAFAPPASGPTLVQ